MNDGRCRALEVDTAVSEPDALGLEYIDCPAEVVSHGAGRGVARALPLSHGLPV